MEHRQHEVTQGTGILYMEVTVDAVPNKSPWNVMKMLRLEMICTKQ